MGLFSSGPDLNDVIFQLRMSSKQLEREAKRAEKEEKGELIDYVSHQLCITISNRDQILRFQTFFVPSTVKF